MTWPRFLRGVARTTAFAIAVAAFSIAGWIALKDHTATATAVGTFGLALMILSILDLESFEALGIKAKLKDTLADAEEKVRGLDKITVTLAKSAFIQVARGPLTHEERRVMVSDLTEALIDAQMETEQIEELKRPFYTSLALKLWFVFGGIRGQYSSAHINYVQQRMMQTPQGSEKDALQAEFERLKYFPNLEYPNEQNVYQFRRLLEQSAAVTPLAVDADRAVIDRMTRELSDMFEESIKAGNYTPDLLNALGQSEDMRNPFMRRMANGFSLPPTLYARDNCGEQLK